MCSNALAESIGPDSGSPHKILEAIRHSAESMSRLINDLLDVASIEAGRLAIEPRIEPSAAAMMDNVAQMFSALASERGITLVSRSLGEVPPVWADADRMLQALANLVSNAIKFTEPGGRIILSVGPDTRGVRFAVQDTGAGIPSDDLPYVLDRFWQRPRSNGERGTGLGLAIVRGIVEAHGGRLVAMSTEGIGSEFSFTIPAAN
jgi:signal transduction histidine kinase